LGKTGFGGCSPIVQKAGEVKFLDKDPKEYWSDPNFKSVPAMYGTNKHEGTYVMSSMAYTLYIKK
jgi:hypothetical protein